MVITIFFQPNIAYGIALIGDYENPNSDDYYETNNEAITELDLVYTGSSLTEVTGFKTGSLLNGIMLRSARNSALGYTFFQPNQVKSLATSLNGNPDYVVAKVKETVLSRYNGTGTPETWVWSRDLGRASGAAVDVTTIPGQYDESGQPKIKVIFTSTKFPEAKFSNANGTTTQTAKVDESIFVHVFAEEYDPYQSKIRWELKVDGVIFDSTSGAANTSIRSIPMKFTEEGIHTLTLTAIDGIERKTVKTHKISVGTDATPPPQEAENLPPIAEISVLPFYYWPEVVEINTISHDPEDKLVSEEWTIDGQVIPSNQWSSSRVTEKVIHQAGFQNMDDGGLTASDAATFEILPTIPKAKKGTKGELKQNRAVIFDAKESDLVSPVHIAPIDYSLTSWKIVPKTEGLTMEDIKTRPSADPSIKQVLFKKPGVYELQLTVTNKYNETSEVLVEELNIRPDEKPFADFTVDKSVYLRDVTDNKQATVTLTDNSASVDGDSIQQRIWYVEFDANNNGIFEPTDGGKQVLSSANLTTLQHKIKHVGAYRYSLEVKEKFGEATFAEFVLPEEYLTDKSDVIDNTGTVATYLKPENFNLPLSETAILVDNVPPVIDFAAKRKNSVSVVLDFGGMDVATLQQKTGARSGGGVNNGGGGGQFNHYYYQVDESAKNRLTAHAGSLEADLRLKGLDATVDINNCYYREMDLDGECVTNVPVWGNVDRGSYAYSSYSGSSPYSGSWEVTSSGSQFVETWCYSSYWTWSDAKKKMVEIIDSHPPPCSSSANASGYTQYWANLRKYVSDWRFEITKYVNEGCGIDNRPGDPTSDPSGIDEKIDTTDFTDGFSNFAFNNAAYKYYFRMDKNQWTWRNNTTKKNLVINTINNKNVFFWSNADNSLRTDAQTLISSSGKEGRYSQYNTSNLQSNVQTLRDELLNKFLIEENPESLTIVLGDKLDYTTVYEDYENDPEIQREWKFVHDPTSVNGRVIDAQPSGPIAQSGLYISAPMQLTEVGEYTVTLRAKDNPLSDTGNDARFAEYRKWSDEEIVREYKINVHRRPFADFKTTVEPGTLKLTLDPSSSFDPDHEFNWDEIGIVEKGIVEYTWEKYVVNEVEYGGKPPATLQPMTDYYVTLRVKDIDGAYGFITKLVTTKNVNLKPVALFDSPSVVLRTDSLNTPGLNSYIRDRSYDPNGDPLTGYNWTVKRQSDGVVVWSGSSSPTSFQAMGLPTGKYLIGLTVRDIPKYPPSLQSDLYEREITVTNNNPPNSCFELSRTIITTASITCADGMTSPYTLFMDETAIYTDKSTDPDGHSLINYSWTIEKLSATNEVLNTWNTGSPPVDFSVFDGVGKYRVSQVVFDNPPSPLPSLSGKYTRIFNVIKGPQAPYAMFEYTPLLPIQGETINLKDQSVDEDGLVVQWEWKIVAPNGSTTTQTTQNPSITNAQIGTYKVTLNVWDNNSPTRLKSKNPAYKEIIVTPAPPNLPPVPFIVWDPFKPFLGDTITLNPDASYDLDGTIQSYQWTIKSKEGVTTNSSTRYPTQLASSQFYDVTLTVRDNDGVTATTTQRINVDIARLIPLVTHTPEWKDYWTLEGFDEDVNTFLAGEQFVVRLVTTPANRVQGSVNFGGNIGIVQIPSSSFQLVSTSTYEYVWEAVLWREDFEDIAIGQYAFEFTGFHPINTPTVQSKGFYLIDVVGSIYDVIKYHQGF
jgi:PKD repeat protein